MTINALDGFQQRQANRWLAIANYLKDRTRVLLLFPDSNDLFRSVIGNQIGVNTNLRNGMVRGPQFISWHINQNRLIGCHSQKPLADFI